MLTVGLIGHGAIAQYVAAALSGIGAELSFCITRPGRERAAREAFGSAIAITEQLDDLRPDVVVDCAGHAGLRQHGPGVLRAGVPLVTLSLGALADASLYDALTEAATAGGTKLHLCSGAIGGLDALGSARFGRLDSVQYTGRKPPLGWKGSRAEELLDLDTPLLEPVTHFQGSARDAALLYPKNANVAAAVALAGLGFDATEVTLIADSGASANIHEIAARGDFGDLRFAITGQTLPDNPRTSALAAISVVRTLSDMQAAITL